MNQLSKEAKQLIEESANSFGNLRIRHGFKLGAEVALTTPVLLEKQGLISLDDAQSLSLTNWAEGVKAVVDSNAMISLEDAMGFAEWYAGQDTWEGDRYREVSEMFQIYKQQTK